MFLELLKTYACDLENVHVWEFHCHVAFNCGKERKKVPFEPLLHGCVEFLLDFVVCRFSARNQCGEGRLLFVPPKGRLSDEG